MISGLTNSTTCYWRANASNIGGTGWSNAWSFTTIVAPPTAPVLASPTNGAGNQPVSLILGWGSILTTAYEVQVSTDGSFGSPVVDQAGFTAPFASVSGLLNNMSYYWRANAANIGGTSGWSSTWSFAAFISAPVAPVLASPTNNAIDLPVPFTLSWGSVAYRDLLWITGVY